MSAIATNTKESKDKLTTCSKFRDGQHFSHLLSDGEGERNRFLLFRDEITVR
jgi:hypothetical protein